MANAEDLSQHIKDVFISAYRRNCLLDDCDPAEDEAALTALTSTQAIDCLKELLDRLLTEKKDLRSEETYELQTRCQQFERMLQKLEGEVRSHIRVEQQLKLQIEASQEKLDAYIRAENSLPATQADDPSPPYPDPKESSKRGFHSRFLSEFGPLVSNPVQQSLKKSKSSMQLAAYIGGKSSDEWAQKVVSGVALDSKKRDLMQARSDRKIPNPKEAPSRRTIFDRPTGALATDRLVPLKALNTDRKGGYSPYRGTTAVRSLSKVRGELVPSDGKKHARAAGDGKKSVGRAVKLL